MTDRHIFDPELDHNWIALNENTLDGIIKTGVWEIETSMEFSFGWVGYTLDTFKDRIRCNFDLDSIQAFDMKFNTFDGTTFVQSLSDRSDSSFYDPVTPNSLPNARIVPSYHLEPYIFWVDEIYDKRPDLELQWRSDHRHWTLFRKYACYTIKYAFGGTKDSGWWTPLDHKWDTYPEGITRLNSNNNLSVNFMFDGPPYIQRTEFSVEWFKYKFTFDWPTQHDLGCRLDDWYYKWYTFYNVTTGYDKFATPANLTKYDPYLGEPQYQNPNLWSFRYNAQDNVSFGYSGNLIKIYSNPFNAEVSLGNSIQLWSVIQWAGVSKLGRGRVVWSALTGTFEDFGNYVAYTPAADGNVVITASYENLTASIVVKVGSLIQYTLSSDQSAVGSGQVLQLQLVGGTPTVAAAEDLAAELITLTSRLDFRVNLRPPEFDTVITSIPEFGFSFGPRLGVWDVTTAEVIDDGWGYEWGIQEFGV